MSQYLPYGGFEWVDPSEFELKNAKCDSEEGYILEVDR